MGGNLSDVLVYALGGGHGHAIRGAGVAAALYRRGVGVELLVPAARRELVQTVAPSVPVLAPSLSDASLPQVVARKLETSQALLVDTFPEGVRQELKSIATPRWGLLRFRRDAAGERFRDALAECAGALDLEPNLNWLEGDVDRLAPVARAIGDRAQDDGSVCLLDGGDEALARLYDKLGPRLHALGLAVCRRSASGPLLTFSGLPRVVVGPAGYNLTYELARASIHHLAIPRPRPFDDQARRARRVAEVFPRPEALETRILEHCLRPAARAAITVADYDAVAEWFIERV